MRACNYMIFHIFLLLNANFANRGRLRTPLYPQNPSFSLTLWGKPYENKGDNCVRAILLTQFCHHPPVYANRLYRWCRKNLAPQLGDKLDLDAAWPLANANLWAILVTYCEQKT